MTFLELLVYVAAVAGFAFLTLCLASGLYYLAELVEEYTVMTRRAIKYTTYFVAGCHVCLMLFDAMPLLRSLFSLGCLGFYTLLLPDFPNISVTNPTFLVSCVLVIVNHFLWFFYFTQFHYSFREIATFFGIVVWIVPFMYFISLSASEYTLPTSDPNAPAKRPGLVKSLISYIARRTNEPPQYPTYHTQQHVSPSQQQFPAAAGARGQSSFVPPLAPIRQQHQQSQHNQYSYRTLHEQQQQQQQQQQFYQQQQQQSASSLGYNDGAAQSLPSQYQGAGGYDSAGVAPTPPPPPRGSVHAACSAAVPEPSE